MKPPLTIRERTAIGLRVAFLAAAIANVISYFVRSHGSIAMDGVEAIGFPLVFWLFNGFQGSWLFDPIGLAWDLMFVLAVAIAITVTLHDKSRLRTGITRSARRMNE